MIVWAQKQNFYIFLFSYVKVEKGQKYHEVSTGALIGPQSVIIEKVPVLSELFEKSHDTL